MTPRANGSLGKLIRISTSFPGFSLFLRERTLIAVGHVNPHNLGANKNLHRGMVVKDKIVAVVRKTQIHCRACTLERHYFEVYWSLEKVYGQGFSYFTRAFDLKMVQVVVDSRKVSFTLKTFDSSWQWHEARPFTDRFRTANLCRIHPQWLLPQVLAHFQIIH